MLFILVWINGWDVWRWFDLVVLVLLKGKFDKLVMYWESVGFWGGGWEFFNICCFMWVWLCEGVWYRGWGLYFSIWLVFGILLSCLLFFINKDGSYCFGNIFEIRVYCMYFYFFFLDKKIKKKRVFLMCYVIIMLYKGVLCYFFF